MNEINKFITIQGGEMGPVTLSFVRDKSAVTSIEYALLGSLIAVVILAGVTNLGINLLALYNVVGLTVAAAA